MEAQIKNYTICFGIKTNITTFGEIEEEISVNDVQIQKNMEFSSFTSQSTIEYVKMAFCSSTFSKFNCCICMTSLCYKTQRNTYQILSGDDNKKLGEFNHAKLYLIKIKNLCNCQYEKYNNYLTKYRFEIIKQLKKSDDKISELERINTQQISTTKDFENHNDALVEENNKKDEEIKQLKKEIERLNKRDELKYLKDLNYESCYDIIININSIKNLKRIGWEVKFTEQGKNNYETYKDKTLIKIGAIGNNNKGKSFVLSKISQMNLLTGTGIDTEGLSVKYPALNGSQGNNLILLDTAGIELPVLTKNDKIENLEEFQENIRDKKMTELFLTNLIINISDILLVVVGKLTFSEQLLINKVKEDCKKQNKGKIFIVHNLQEFSFVEQVEKYIETTLKKCTSLNLKQRIIINLDNKVANIEENEGNEKIENKKDKESENGEDIINKNVIDNEKEDEINIIQEEKKENEKDENEVQEKEGEIPINENNIYIHPPKLKENNEKENKKENEKVDKKQEREIKDQKHKSNGIVFTEIENFGDNKKLEIYHLIIANENSEAGLIYNQYAYDFVKNYFNLVSDLKEFDILEQVKDNFKILSTTMLTNSIQNFDFNSNEDILKDEKIQLKLKENKEENKDEDLILRGGVVDELGSSNFKKGNLDLKYNYFKKDHQTLEIRIEIPGKIQSQISHKVIGDETIVTIKGTKQKDKYPENPKDDLFNKREFGEFELNIPLKVQDFKIIPTQEEEKLKPKFINGICCIQFKLASKEEENKIEANFEDNEDL